MYRNYGKFGKGPVRHLPDCDGYKYGLQLNIYRYILRKYYDINIKQMLLVSFHPDLKHYFLAEIPVMEREVEDIFRELQQESQQHYQQ